MRRVPMIINGEKVESTSSNWIDVLNPATQEVVAQVPMATLDEVDHAIENAHQAFQTWKKVPLGQRMRIMLKLQHLIRENTATLAELITLEHGKTLPDAEGEVGRGLEVVEHACSITSLQLGEMANNVAGNVDVYTLQKPLGVGAGITAFNFPVMLPCFMFPLALATGNTFVLKPSEQDPTSSLFLAELALEAGVPPGVLNVVHGGPDVANRLCEHPLIKAVSFIGSTHVGTQVYQRASEHNKRAQCMMGAKNHCIVMPDCDKEQAINNILGAAYGAAGQRCMANSVVILVGKTRQWLDEIAARSHEMKVGPGTDRSADLGPVITPAAKARIIKLIDSGVKQGANLMVDGRECVVDGYEQGNFVGPTMFSGVTTDMDIYRQEIFGPALLILEADTFEQAVEIINNNPNGNGASIFTNSGFYAQRFQNEADAGQLGINIPIPVPVAYFSFTGSRGSKLGDLGPNGKQAIAFWTQTKTVSSRWFAPDEVAGEVNTTITMK
ncbi:CoA-acylating methylmalonate-semialdehyde dehydrogenase [Psychrobium sp. 1_MG-2023]|uniref:CoA-acylating methylmalonate-semialdehyde dehydrogenase n=1 Tax=Psychrobium sp. 1_MG-2023 TaxID=3062624 RepID=UPI0027329241|nr:CoA-acylating methylmalonate-semialdehyde dehydrogenase [Psychrobium sp. 1_MG-2023]MDP2561448.1 CoA-acylating methylmalonate-semialdehyde dehydrogenase [Psychrobium sp. 1_MG-2023]